MNIKRHLLSNVYRSPDDPVADPPSVDPAAPPVVDAPADPPVPVASDPAAVDPPAPPAEPKAPGWFLPRLAEESEAKRVAEAEVARLRSELNKRNAGDPPAPVRTLTADSPEFNEAVARRASEIKLGEDSTAVLSAGVAKFPDFTQSVDLLGKLGVTHDEFVVDLVAADKENGHVILDALAKNPERAIALAKMPSRQRLAELVRMSTALSPAPKPAASAAPAPAVSRAPRPAPALAPVNEGGDDPLTSDAGTDEEFSAAWDRQYKGPRQVA